jgi:hypothetical protein
MQLRGRRPAQDRCSRFRVDLGTRADAPMDAARQLLMGGTVGAAAALADAPLSGQPRGQAVTGIIGARRAWTVSMISALSMPCR